MEKKSFLFCLTTITDSSHLDGNKDCLIAHLNSPFWLGFKADDYFITLMHFYSWSSLYVLNLGIQATTLLIDASSVQML